MMDKKYFLVIPMFLFLLTSCNETKLKNEYHVKDSFEIVAGEYTGTKGETEYTIKLSDYNYETNTFFIENFAKEYKIKSIVKGDSIFIPSQKFEYYQSYVTIFGNGKVKGDSIYVNYFSGGPQGQIEARCVGVASK